MELEPDGRSLHTTLSFTHQPRKAFASQVTGERMLVDIARQRYHKTAYLYHHVPSLWQCHAVATESSHGSIQGVSVVPEFAAYGGVVTEYCTHSVATLLGSYDFLKSNKLCKGSLRTVAAVAMHSVPSAQDLLTGAKHSMLAYQQGCTSIDFAIASTAGICLFEYPRPDNKRDWNEWKDLVPKSHVSCYELLYAHCIKQGLRTMSKKKVTDCLDGIAVMANAVQQIAPGVTVTFKEATPYCAELVSFIEKKAA